MITQEMSMPAGPQWPGRLQQQQQQHRCQSRASDDEHHERPGRNSSAYLSIRRRHGSAAFLRRNARGGGALTALSLLFIVLLCSFDAARSSRPSKTDHQTLARDKRVLFGGSHQAPIPSPSEPDLPPAKTTTITTTTAPDDSSSSKGNDEVVVVKNKAIKDKQMKQQEGPLPDQAQMTKAMHPANSESRLRTNANGSVVLPDTAGLVWIANTDGWGCCFLGEPHGSNDVHAGVTDTKCEELCSNDDNCFGVNIGPLQEDGTSLCEVLVPHKKGAELTICQEKESLRCLIKSPFVDKTPDASLTRISSYGGPFHYLVDFLEWQKTQYDSRRFTGKAFANQNDVARSVKCFVANFLCFVGGFLLFLWAKSTAPKLFCRLKENEILFWLTDDEANRQILRVAGVDGMMLLRFFRLSVHILVVLAVANMVYLFPAQIYHSSKYQFFQHPGRDSCIGTTAIDDEKVCYAAAHVYADHSIYEFVNGTCKITQGPGAPILVCNKEAGFMHFVVLFQAFAIQNIGEFSLRRPGIYLYILSMITTVLTVQWLMRRFILEFLHWRYVYMVGNSNRSTVYIKKMPEGMTNSGLRKFCENLVAGGVTDTFLVKHPPPKLMEKLSKFTKKDKPNKRRDRAMIAQQSYSEIPEARDWKSLRCGFVTFERVRDAHAIAHMYLRGWDLDIAPEPGELLWGAMLLHNNPKTLMFRRVVAVCGLTCLYILWSIPVAMISLFSTEQLARPLAESSWAERWPALKTMIASDTGILTAFWMMIFMSFLPMMFEGLAYLYGFRTMREVNSWIQRHYMWFFVLYVIFLNSFTQSLVEFLETVLDRPISILTILGRALPDLSWWYINYTTFAFMGLICELLRPGRVIGHYLYRLCYKKDLWEQYYLDLPEAYGTLASRWLVYLAIAILWSSMNPSICVVTCVILSVARAVYKYEVLCCYREVYDTGGLWVPVAIKDITLILILYQVAMAGVIHERCSEKGGLFYVVFILVNCPLLVSSLSFYKYVDGKWDFTHLYQNISHETPADAKPIADYRAAYKQTLKAWEASIDAAEKVASSGRIKHTSSKRKSEANMGPSALESPSNAYGAEAPGGGDKRELHKDGEEDEDDEDEEESEGSDWDGFDSDGEEGMSTQEPRNTFARSSAAAWAEANNAADFSAHDHHDVVDAAAYGANSSSSSGPHMAATVSGMPEGPRGGGAAMTAAASALSVSRATSSQDMKKKLRATSFAEILETNEPPATDAAGESKPNP